jgi:DNA-binding MarR family transcriptional regulator
MDDRERSPYCRCLYFSANALARSITRLAEDAFAPTGLSPSQAFILMTVSDRPGVHPGEVAQKMHLTTSTVTRLIDALERRALVRRTTGGRAVAVQPTKEGARLAEAVRDAWRQLYLKYSGLLGEGRARQLTEEIYAAHEVLTGFAEKNQRKTRRRKNT